MERRRNKKNGKKEENEWRIIKERKQKVKTRRRK